MSTSSRALICGSGSDIARELAVRLKRDDWEVESVSGRSLLAPQGRWDLLILAHGQLTPIDRFFECDMNEWVGGVMVNAVYPLSCLRAAWPQRRTGATVVFMGGPNMLHPSPTYSAYRAGKAMIEALATTLEAEYPDCYFRVLHPGVVRTKIHEQTIAAGAKAANYKRVLGIVSGKETTVTHDEVYLRLKELLKELPL